MSSSEEHFTYAMELVTSTSLTMVLVNAIKLKVLDTIADAGPDAQLSAHKIASRLSILNQDAPNMLDRMLMLLASHSIVTCTKSDHESKPTRVYGLAPVARYFISNEDGGSLAAMMELHNDRIYIESWFKLKDSVVEGGVAFEKVYGKHVFEYLGLDARFNRDLNKAMVDHSTAAMTKILECYHGFDYLKSVVDVGGGLGIATNMIVSKHPKIQGINFDLPHVIQHAPQYNGVKHVGGDMFQEIPQGEAIFMKFILHDWSDEYCIKLLKNCYKSLPYNGKVIVVDNILPFLPETSSSAKAAIQLDAIMMILSPGGKERTEDEFLALAKAGGFSGIRKECFVCNLWVMEFYM